MTRWDRTYDAVMTTAPTRQELEDAHCWERDDLVPHRPAMTEFRQRARLHQARWREAEGHPIGTQPISPSPKDEPARLIGSRVPLDYGKETGANFVTDAALDAARARTATIEPHQSFDHQRLWADLLGSSAAAFNLFGDLAADVRRADRAVHRLWPDTPGIVTGVAFAHSPGRLDPQYLGNLMHFDVMFTLDLGDETEGLVAADVKYHERAHRNTSKPQRLPRYRQVADRAGIFTAATVPAVDGTDLLTMWLEHLLVHSMLQDTSGRWRWGRYVVLHPEGNVDTAEHCVRYRALLTDAATFATLTIEELLTSGALPRPANALLRRRYVVT
jgi:hypothetical protein